VTNVHISLKSRLDMANVLGKILWQNVHSLLIRWQDITNVQKSCDKMSTLRWKAGWTSQTCWEKSCDKTSTCRWVDMMSQSILGRVDIMSQVTNCPPWSRGGRKICGRIV
jgi:hypothetical protein